MNKRCLQIVFLLLCCGFCAAARPPKIDHLAEGRSCYSTYRFAEAKEHFLAVLDDAKATEEQLAAAEDELHRTETALRYFRRVEDVCVTDSLSFPRAELMQHLPKMSADMGEMRMEGDVYTCTNQRGDRRYIAVRSADGRSTIICKQERLIDGWSEPDTLPASINRYAHQAYPLLMPDGLTLYYAACSDEGLGEWDIYMTKFNPVTDSYLMPEALGMPYNSIRNDYLFLLDESAGRGWFVSDRRSCPGYLTLYTFVVGEKRLLRDSSDLFVRDVAMINILRQPVVEEEEEEEELPALRQDEEVHVVPVDFRILVGDTIYTSLADFRQPEARDKAEAYLEQMEVLEAQKAELNQLRKQYFNSETDEERRHLAPRILALEKELPVLREQAALLLTQLRLAEAK